MVVRSSAQSLVLLSRVLLPLVLLRLVLLRLVLLQGSLVWLLRGLGRLQQRRLLRSGAGQRHGRAGMHFTWLQMQQPSNAPGSSPHT
jgi:hypothetical protein